MIFTRPLQGLGRYFSFSITAVLIFASTAIGADSNDTLAQALACFEQGNVDGGIEKCTEIMFSEGQPDAQLKAYVLTAIAYKLQKDPDLVDRCEGFRDLLSESNAQGKDYALAIIDFMCGKASKTDVQQKLTNAGKDWIATAGVCRYLNQVEKDPEIKQLYEIYKLYSENIAGLAKNDWAVVWRSRFPKWQKYLQGSPSEETMEKLFVECSPAKKQQEVQDDQSEQITMINQVIQLYLAGDVEAGARQAKKQAQSLRDINPEKYQLAGKILDYLAGTKGVDQQDIFKHAQTNPSLWALASIAMFARDVAANDLKKLDQRQLLHHIDNYNGNHHLLKNQQAIAQWKARTGPWEKWCLAKFKETEGLEPLLANKSKVASKTTATPTVGTFKNLAEVTLEEFTASREVYKKRPQPASMDFDDNEFKRYLSSLPKELHAGEIKRYSIVKEIKLQLVRIMERNTYRGMVRTKKGSKSGLIQMANINLVIFKKNDRAKPKRYKWSDLMFAQYILFFEHYAKQRMAVTAGQYGKEESHFYAANDYLALAILCDWFGHYEDALKYSQKAVTISPSISASGAQIMLQ